MSSPRDVTLRCADCGREFTFSARDQEFYKEKGYAPPKRCKGCRDVKKAQRHGEGEKGGKK